jgi:hypothetical protein
MEIRQHAERAKRKIALSFFFEIHETDEENVQQKLASNSKAHKFVFIHHDLVLRQGKMAGRRKSLRL